MSRSNGFSVEQVGKTLVVAPTGSVGSLAADEHVRQGTALLETIRDSDSTALIVDLSQLDYFGSLLLATLCQVWQIIKERHGTMSVCDTSGVAREVLTNSGLSSLWSIHPSRESDLEELDRHDSVRQL
jgi:anti-anti-sigma factor